MDLEPDEKDLDDEDLLNETLLVTTCGGLVVVDPERDVIRLVRYTT